MAARRKVAAAIAAGSRKRGGALACGALVAVLAVLVGWELGELPSEQQIAKLRRAPVQESALMKVRRRELGRGRKLQHQWVELEAISPTLIAAVLASEDARFFDHRGVDFAQLRSALQERVTERRQLRGASTITQQVAKNLFLSGERSLLRKLRELIIASRLESTLGKRRILALYLNIAEWGPGVFGAEAAARRWFSKSAAELDLAEGAVLASMLPNPLRFNPEQQPQTVARRALHVLDRIEVERLAPAETIAEARERIPELYPAETEED